jgi:hypothetical protein
VNDFDTIRRIFTGYFSPKTPEKRRAGETGEKSGKKRIPGPDHGPGSYRGAVR